MREFESGKSKYRPHKAKSASIAGNSPTVINALVGFFRRVFEIGMRGGIVTKNPALVLKRMRPRKKLLELPNKEEFAKMIEHIRTTAGRGRIVADLVEGLSYSGMRVDESRRLLWQHLDFSRGLITVHGTKTAESARIIPMTEAFRELTLGMKEYRDTALPTERVFQSNVATLSLARACEHIGRKKMTHHDLRHLFATTCIESGVDVPTVAKWLGHSDGGALAMKTYGHIRLLHSVEAAKKVKFK
jgi:integrase